MIRRKRSLSDTNLASLLQKEGVVMGCIRDIDEEEEPGYDNQDGDGTDGMRCLLENSDNCSISGLLEVKAKSSVWNRKFCILKENSLYFLESANHQVVSETADLTGCDVTATEDGTRILVRDMETHLVCELRTPMYASTNLSQWYRLLQSAAHTAIWRESHGRNSDELAVASLESKRRDLLKKIQEQHTRSERTSIDDMIDTKEDRIFREMTSLRRRKISTQLKVEALHRKLKTGNQHIEQQTSPPNKSKWKRRFGLLNKSDDKNKSATLTDNKHINNRTRLESRLEELEDELKTLDTKLSTTQEVCPANRLKSNSAIYGSVDNLSLGKKKRKFGFLNFNRSSNISPGSSGENVVCTTISSPVLVARSGTTHDDVINAALCRQNITPSQSSQTESAPSEISSADDEEGNARNESNTSDEVCAPVNTDRKLSLIKHLDNLQNFGAISGRKRGGSDVISSGIVPEVVAGRRSMTNIEESPSGNVMNEIEAFEEFLAKAKHLQLT